MYFYAGIRIAVTVQKVKLTTLKQIAQSNAYTESDILNVPAGGEF